MLGIAVLGLLLGAVAVQAENWPQFRGSSHQGVSMEKNVPLHWSSTSNLVWKTGIPGEGWSSPIVWNSKVFVTTAIDAGQSCHVLCLDASSGTILWDKEVFRQALTHKQSRNSFATPTPATDGERVYACFGDGSFAALSLSGELEWTNRDYPFYGEHGLGTSPILHRGLLIMARDGSSEGEDKKLGWQKPWDQSFVLALDTKTGKQRWKGRRGLSRISHGAPNIWEHEGKTEVITEAGDVLQAFDFETGDRLWSSEVIGEGKVPSVVIGDGLAFTSGGWSGKDSIKAFRLGGTGEQKERNLVWEQKKDMPKIPSMLYSKPYLFAVTEGGAASCLKADTGEQVWRERVGSSFSASPVTAEGRIYFLGDNGETTVVEAGPEFKVLARNPLGERAQASIAISQGHLFIRTVTNLYCIGTKEPEGNLSAGLIGYWQFEDAGGQVKDSSNRANHGVLRGAVSVEGKFGKAVDCKQDALAEVAHTPVLDDTKEGLTVSAWVNRTEDATWNMIVSREVKDGPSEYFGLAVVKNKALFSVDPDGAHYRNIKTATEMPVGEWIHLAGTYDDTEFKLYVNGKLAASEKCSIPFSYQDQNPVIIGGNTNNKGKTWVDCFRGRIDEVRLYNRALTGREVSELFEAKP